MSKWKQAIKDFSWDELNMFIEIFQAQFDLPDDMMNENVVSIIAARDEGVKVKTKEALSNVGGITVTVSEYYRIKDFCDAGKKINAIKELRMATGSGLKEAKEAVETEFFYTPF